MQDETDVSFSVYKIGSQTASAGEIISFEGVRTNNGGHFDTEVSIYTCPLNGTYFFTFSMFAALRNDGEMSSASVTTYGEPVSGGHCTNFNLEYSLTQCSNSVIMHCESIQQVYIAPFGSLWWLCYVWA